MADQGVPVIGPILNRLVGTRNERFVKRYTSRVRAIGELEEQIRQLTDEQLRGMVDRFREQYDRGTSIDGLLVEVFAVAREAMDRAVGVRNIFSPDYADQFDPSRLPEHARELYERTKSEIESLEPREPDGDLLGSSEPVPAWVWHPIPNEIYDAVRELYPESRPPFRSRPFDVQLIGGMVLAGGKIAEMKTGEGKTIVAPLACLLAGVERQQVHIVTVNDYLVQRDRDWTFPFFYALGMTVGAIHPSHMQPEQVKRQMYRCDVVYGTTSEFGFDYLRDNMKRSVDQQVQRKRQFAIVDEVDSILIDEARTPLIISGPAHEDAPRYDLADRLARHLIEKQRPWEQAEEKVTACKERIKGLEGDIRQARDKSKVPELQKGLEAERARLPELERERDEHTQYYEKKEDRKSCHLTHEGIAEAQRVAGVGSFYVDENMDIPHLLEQAVRAHAVYERDRDYVVMDVPDQRSGRPTQSIVIVDANTGRPMIGRQWSDGLHQAVEAKEGVPIKEETQTVATITIQNFFKMYKRLAGMTGTADTEAQEFHDIYGLDVVSIPTNEPVIRRDAPDLVYLRAKDKWEAIVDEIKGLHDVGRPILVGTTSVARSEMLSDMLKRKHGVRHEVLNAKQHEREGQIISGAGQLGAVMIATNMAGRGTDIKLGSFTRQELLEHWLRRGICSKRLTVDATERELRDDVYRKIAPGELELRKRDVEEMTFEELELALFRHWALHFTLMSERAIESASADELLEGIDEGGRVILHRIRWFRDVEDMGGLHVIGTERHEARRIDNQLRGRAGRQGDQGSSRFYVSLEDDLMKMFGGETMMKILPRLGLKEGDAIESNMLSKRIEGAQRKVEERNFQVRKNILEYDEVMEQQRQTFYGMRQRVLEGRDVRGLIFEFIEESVADAVERYLDPMYPLECAAEFAKERLETSVLAERLRNRDASEVDAFIRKEAKSEARHNIDITLGEYIPMEGSEIPVDFDSAGLVRWAKNRYGVEIDAGELREGGVEERRHVLETLCKAAERKIDESDLSGLDAFFEPDYGAAHLSEWAETMLGLEVSVEEIKSAEADEERTVLDLIVERAERTYRDKEIEYPVEYAMELTMALMRQAPGQAAEQLAGWARRRFGLEMTAEQLKTTPPARVRERLLEASRRFVEEDRLSAEIEAALACADNDALDAHLRERFSVGLPDRIRWIDPEERDDAIRALIENILRAEMLELERTVLLETLDSSWRDHLYEMDQLRDSISFRAFSQQDPRIAFKREGSQIFHAMLRRIRDRVSEYIFKARVSPAAMVQQAAQATAERQAAREAQQRAAPTPADGGRSAPGVAAAGSVTGPGIDVGSGSGPTADEAESASAPSGQTSEDDPDSANAEPEEAQDAAAQLQAARAARSRDRTKQRKR